MTQPKYTYLGKKFPLTIALQLAFVFVSIFIASSLSEWRYIVPDALKKQTPLSNNQLLVISCVFLLWHIASYALSRLFFKTPLFSSPRRICSELIFALVATSLSSCTIFLLTDLPFSANFYAWIYVIQTASYLLLALLFLFVFSPNKPVNDFLSALSLLLKPWVWLAVVLILLPGFLAFYYKANRDFANFVNLTRATIGGTSQTSWALTPVVQNLDQPMLGAFHPHDASKLFWLSRPGYLYLSNIDPWSNELLLDIAGDVKSIESEMGAMSFALHPEFGFNDSPNSGFVYVWYTHWKKGEQRNKLARFDISLPTQELRQQSRTILLDYPRKSSQMHNGGSLVFDSEGFLFLSIGDAVDLNLTQVLDKQLASGIIRIDVDMRGGEISAPISRRGEDAIAQNYFIPKDNPWFDHPSALQEFWAIGFRNPFRMSIDSKTGDLWLGDVGWDRFEEINKVKPGDNGQWPYTEGLERTRNSMPDTIVGREIQPIYHYPQTALKRAVIGGLVYRQDKHPPLKGQYIFADNNAGLVMRFDPKQPDQDAEVIARADQFAQYGITSLFTDKAGEIYITLLGSKNSPSGELVKLTSEKMSPQNLSVKPTTSENNSEKNYTSFCARCHGEDGKGSPELDAQLVKRPDFTSKEWQDSVTDEHLAQVIELGGEPMGLSPQMPAWGTVFSNSDINHLVEKVRAFQSE